MNAPLLSTITLFTEFIVTAAIVYVFYKSIKTGIFPKKVAFTTLAYEVIFNISYMVYSTMRSETHDKAKEFTWKTGLAIFHGVLSLIMFVTLVAFLIIAYKEYQKKNNYFLKHKIMTSIFIFFWFLSIISGFVLYAATYLLK